MRDWKTAYADFIKPLSDHLRRDGGTQTLRPAQTAAPIEMCHTRGLFLNGRVGVGKSVIIALASRVLSEHLGRPLRTLILFPGGIREETNAHHAEISQHWQVAPGAMPMSYSQISLMPKQGLRIHDLFGPDLGPELICCDEADKLKNVGASGSGVALQVEQYLSDRPETIMVCATGTCDVSGIQDYAHLVYWCLREKSPLPIKRPIILEWSSVIDDGDMKCAPAVRRDLGLGPTSGLEEIREAYYRRLRGTPGLIVEDTPYTEVPLHITEIAIDPPPELEEHWARLRDLGQRPDGADVQGDSDPDRVDPMGMWAVCRRMGRGLCYVWDPLPPPEWMAARKAYYSWERRFVGREQARGNIITPAVVKAFAQEKKAPAWVAWAAIQPTYVPQTKTLWLSEAVLAAAEAWGREAPGVIFVDDIEFGRELSRRTGWDYYQGKGKSASGKPLERKKEGVSRRTVIASRAACGVGLNLQFQWNRILFVAPPNNSRDWEQNIGRCHREGQEIGFDRTDVTVFLTCAEDYGSIRKVVRTGNRIAKSLYRQKAVDWPWTHLKRPPSGGPGDSRAFG